MSSNNTVTSAVLVKVATGMIGKTLTDRQITGEIRAAKLMQGDDTGRWIKNKWGKTALKAMTSCLSESYSYHREHTIPWDDWGYGLVRADMLDAYRAGMAQITEKFRAAVEEFVSALPQIIEDRRAALGQSFDLGDYPTADEMRRECSITMTVAPVPTVDDFSRYAFAQGTLAAVKADHESRLAGIEVTAKIEPYKRVLPLLEKIVATLSAPDKIFRDSLVGNVKEALDVIPFLSLNGDAELTALVESVRMKVAAIDPQLLRDSAAQRERMVEMARDLAAKFSGAVNRKLQK